MTRIPEKKRDFLMILYVIYKTIIYSLIADIFESYPKL